MVSPRETLDVHAAQPPSIHHWDPLTNRAMAGPMARYCTACSDELRWTITSLFGVGVELAAAASVIEGDGRDRVERAITELDQVIVALRHRFYETLERGGDTGPSARTDSSP